MPALPEFAVSVRQPWAWAIIQGYKPVENWFTTFTGPVLIHARVSCRPGLSGCIPVLSSRHVPA